jgi:putative ABC transport system substrate-binding protein
VKRRTIYLSLRTGPGHLEEAFRQGLRDLGYVEGRNISVEYRYADWNPERVSNLAEELVGFNVSLIVATGGNVTALGVKGG